MLSARLQMRQSQQLVLTPQLLQSIRLLQYSHAELQSFVDAEIERNPLLDRADDRARSPAPDFDEPTSSGAPNAEPDGTADRNSVGAPAERRRDAGALRPPMARGGDAAAPRDLDGFADHRPSLTQHALGEVADALRDPLDRRIGIALAEHLDEAGYLRGAAEEIAAAAGAAPDRVEQVIARLQASVEPAGLFARDLAECLTLQLRRGGRFDPVIGAVVANLDLLARRDFAALRRLTGEDEAGLMDILAEIRRLDPKPGHGFDRDAAVTVVPDVIVAPAPDGSWRVELNPETLPRVLVNEDYGVSVNSASLRQVDQAFLAQCQASAGWLVRSLDQRARTILKVTAEIVRRQDDFLTRGIAGLKPMTLMSVAEAVGLHESTVSRVTSNKSVATPRGTFEMKFFFTVAIQATGGGEAHSAESVKHRIRMLIDTETAAAVLSDDDIAERLRKEGIDLARRTVAKYREALGIPSSIQRRREINARRLAS